jgi:hypothetical protein
MFRKYVQRCYYGKRTILRPQRLQRWRAPLVLYQSCSLFGTYKSPMEAPWNQKPFGTYYRPTFVAILPVFVLLLQIDHSGIRKSYNHNPSGQNMSCWVSRHILCYRNAFDVLLAKRRDLHDGRRQAETAWLTKQFLWSLQSMVRFHC